MNSFNPFQPEELTELERLQAQMRGEVVPLPGSLTPLNPTLSQLRSQMDPQPTGDFRDKSAEWLRANPASPEFAAFKANFQDGQDPSTWDDAAWARAAREKGDAHAAAPALDLTMPTVAPRKGMITGSVTTETNPYADRLMDLHKQLSDQQTATINRSGQVEAGIQDRHIKETSGRITDARDRETQTQIQLTAEQAAKAKLQKEGAEWAARKDQPEKAFEGMEWAGILGAIGLASGVFSQAMGWQNGNPVKDAFNEHIERTISAQREQKNSMLKQIEARLGDSIAAESLLRAQLRDAATTRYQAEVEQSGNLDVQARNGPVIEAQHKQIQKDLLNTWERLSPRQSESQVRAPGKAGPPTLAQQLAEQEAAQKLRQGKVSALKEGGFSEEEAQEEVDKRFPSLAAIGRGQTTAQREDETKAAAKAKEDAAKAKELSPVERQKVVDRVDGLVESVQGLEELDSAVGFVRGADGDVISADDEKLSRSIKPGVDQFSNSALRGLPFKIGAPMADWSETKEDEEVKKVKRVADKIVFGQAKAEGQGALSEGDRAVYRARLPVSNAESLKTASAESWRQRRVHYKNLVGQIGKAEVDAMLRARGIDPATVSGEGAPRVVGQRRIP